MRILALLALAVALHAEDAESAASNCVAIGIGARCSHNGEIALKLNGSECHIYQHGGVSIVGDKERCWDALLMADSIFSDPRTPLDVRHRIHAALLRTAKAFHKGLI